MGGGGISAGGTTGMSVGRGGVPGPGVTGRAAFQDGWFMAWLSLQGIPEVSILERR
jgi:hypothetical protein